MWININEGPLVNHLVHLFNIKSQGLARDWESHKLDLCQTRTKKSRNSSRRCSGNQGMLQIYWLFWLFRSYYLLLIGPQQCDIIHRSQSVPSSFPAAVAALHSTEKICTNTKLWRSRRTGYLMGWKKKKEAKMAFCVEHRTLPLSLPPGMNSVLQTSFSTFVLSLSCHLFFPLLSCCPSVTPSSSPHISLLASSLSLSEFAPLPLLLAFFIPKSTSKFISVIITPQRDIHLH